MAKKQTGYMPKVTKFEQPLERDPDRAKIHFTDHTGGEMVGDYRASALEHETKTLDLAIKG